MLFRIFNEFVFLTLCAVWYVCMYLCGCLLVITFLSGRCILVCKHFLCISKTICNDEISWMNLSTCTSNVAACDYGYSWWTDSRISMIICTILHELWRCRKMLGCYMINIFVFIYCQFQEDVNVYMYGLYGCKCVCMLV